MQALVHRSWKHPGEPCARPLRQLVLRNASGDLKQVYVYFGSYGLVSYDLDGNKQWERPLPLPLNIYGTAASPIVADDVLLVNHQGTDSHLLAVDRRTGDTVWKKDRLFLNEYGWSTPVLWRHDGVDEVVLFGGDFEPNQRLMAYNLADGSERWWLSGLPPSGKSTPVIMEGADVRVVQGGDGAGFALEPLLQVRVGGDMLGQHLDGDDAIQAAEEAHLPGIEGRL